MIQFRISLLILISFLIWGSSCKSDPKNSTPKNKVETKKQSIPRFDPNSAYEFIQKQTEFGSRVMGTQAHEDCKNWMVSEFKSMGAEVIEQNFTAKVYTGEKFEATNIIAQFNPNKKKRMLLTSHWDSRHISDSETNKTERAKPVMGADDGASGVGVLLEIGRLIKENGIEIGVDIVLFDAEDYGAPSDAGIDGETTNTWGLGSQYWSAHLHKSGYRPEFGILLDMVGAKGARFPVEEFSAQYAPQQIRKIWGLAKNMGYGDFFVLEDGGGVTDDHYFVNTIAKIPMLDIINLPRNPPPGKRFGAHWHTQDDTMGVIDKKTLKATGRVVTATIYRVANGDF